MGFKPHLFCVYSTYSHSKKLFNSSVLKIKWGGRNVVKNVNKLNLRYFINKEEQLGNVYKVGESLDSNQVVPVRSNKFNNHSSPEEFLTTEIASDILLEDRPVPKSPNTLNTTSIPTIPDIPVIPTRPTVNASIPVVDISIPSGAGVETRGNPRNKPNNRPNDKLEDVPKYKPVKENEEDMIATKEPPKKSTKPKRVLKRDSGDDSVAKRILTGSNTRSDTYRRDFIKKNPPFLGRWYLCSLCNKIIRVENMEVDHIFPVSKGGSNSTYNLGPLCKPCNREKSNKVDSRVAQMYIRKLGGNAIGVPLSLGFRGVTFVGKWGLKGGLCLGKGLLSGIFKGLSVGITAFLASSIKVKLVIAVVVILFLASQGIITIGG